MPRTTGQSLDCCIDAAIVNPGAVAAAKLVGLAPIAHGSGKRSGRRPVPAGRAGLRSVLFVVAEVVRRHNPIFANAGARGHVGVIGC